MANQDTPPTNPDTEELIEDVLWALRKVIVGDAYEEGIPGEDFEAVMEAKAALSRYIQKECLDARIDELHGVQVYTDPSHQIMSPFARLKEADRRINNRLATFTHQKESLEKEK